jgi:hypothetical protein
MKIPITTLALITLLFAAACKTTVEDVPKVSAANQVSVTPTPQTVEITMPILRKIAEFKKSQPARDARQIADYANSILPQFGYEYDFDLRKIVTRKIKQRKTKPVKVEGDGASYVQFDLDVMTTKGAKKVIPVTAPYEESCCCGYYYVPIAVTKVTSKQITVVIDSKETVVARPKEIPVVQEYIFGKEATKPIKIRSWEVPEETYPYGISTDGLKLYVETQIDEILLEISESGTLRFVPKDADGILTESEDLRKQLAPQKGEISHKSGDLGLIRYVLNGVSYVLEFPYPCT